MKLCWFWFFSCYYHWHLIFVFCLEAWCAMIRNTVASLQFDFHYFFECSNCIWKAFHIKKSHRHAAHDAFLKMNKIFKYLKKLCLWSQYECWKTHWSCLLLGMNTQARMLWPKNLCPRMFRRFNLIKIWLCSKNHKMQNQDVSDNMIRKRVMQFY